MEKLRYIVLIHTYNCLQKELIVVTAGYYLLACWPEDDGVLILCCHGSWCGID